MATFCDRLARSPPDLSRRLESLFEGPLPKAAETLEALAKETLDVAGAMRPDIDTSALRDKIGQRRKCRSEETGRLAGN
jgi:hypothetical protein